MVRALFRTKTRRREQRGLTAHDREMVDQDPVIWSASTQTGVDHSGRQKTPTRVTVRARREAPDTSEEFERTISLGDGEP